MSHDHGHSHHEEDESKLAKVAIINTLGFLIELAGGLLFGSVALLSDAIHMLFDALAYVMAWGAEYIAAEYDESERWSYGLHRLEPLSAFVNGALLIPMVGYILYESYTRFITPVEIDAGMTMIIATLGLLINLLSVYILEGGELSLNEKGAYYHLLGDTGASFAVIVSSGVIYATGFKAIDPITAGLISLIIVWSAVKLLSGSAEIFLHTTSVPRSEVEEAILEVDGVVDIFDYHAWSVCSELVIATAHIGIETDDITECERIREEVHAHLDNAGVHHATIELVPESSERKRLTNHSH